MKIRKRLNKPLRVYQFNEVLISYLNPFAFSSLAHRRPEIDLSDLNLPTLDYEPYQRCIGGVTEMWNKETKQWELMK